MARWGLPSAWAAVCKDSHSKDKNRMASESILLVDDNPTNLQMLFQLLEKGVGCKLLVAKNGETALTIARKTKPDLILLDIMMPGIMMSRRIRSGFVFRVMARAVSPFLATSSLQPTLFSSS